MSKVITVQDGDLTLDPTTGNIVVPTTTTQVLLPLSNDAVTPTLAFGDGNTGFYESADNTVRFSASGIAIYECSVSIFQGLREGANGPRLAMAALSDTDIAFTFTGDSDTGIGRNTSDVLTLVAGGVEMLRLVETGTSTTDQIIIGSAGIIGSNATPALAFGDGDSGFYESTDDNIVVALGTVATWDFNGTVFQGVAGGTPALSAVDSTATVPNIHPWKGDLDTGLGLNAADQLSLVSGGVEMLRLTETGVTTTDQLILAPANAGAMGAAGTCALALGSAGNTGFFKSSVSVLDVSIAGVSRFQFNSSDIRSTSSGGAFIGRSAATATVPAFAFVNDGDTGLGTAAANQLSLITGAIEAKRLVAATLQTTAVTTTEIIAVPVASGEGFGFRINIIGTEDATGDTVFESIFGAIRNQAGTTAIVGSSITDRTDDAGASTWVITVAADDTADALTVDVAGEAATTIDWKVSVELLNV